MEKPLTLKEKIYLYNEYARDFFDDCNHKKQILDLIINREDLKEQFENIPDIFWENVIQNKILYVYEDGIKWRVTGEGDEYIISKYQDFNDGPKHIPVIVYEKQFKKYNGKTI